MLNRSFILFFAVFIRFGWSIAQNGSVTGTITLADGEPAGKVTLLLKGTSYETKATEAGFYLIDEVAPGDYLLLASSGDLETAEVIIHVDAGMVTTVPALVLAAKNENSLDKFVVAAKQNRYNENGISNSLRLNEPLIEIPQNIQVVTRAAMDDQQVISMSDGVIRNVSGAVRSEHWGDLYANISARGSQIQAFRNGFNVVNSYWGPLTEDIAFVDHIEFVKGPAGFMLANGDPSGLYNIVTKKPTGKEKGEVSFTLGSFDLYRASVDLDGKLSKSGKLLYRLNVAAQNKKSFRANEFNDRYVIAPVISYQLDQKTKLTMEYNFQMAKMSDVGSFYVFDADGYATLPREFTALPAGMPTTTMKDHSFYLNLDHRINDKWKLTAQVSRFNYYQLGTSMWPSSVNPDGTMIRAIGSWDAKSVMTMAQAFVNGEFNTGSVRHRILAGLDMANKSYLADWGQSHELDSVGAEFNTNDPDYGMPVNGAPDFDHSYSSLEQRARASGGFINQQYTAGYIQDELGFFDNRLRVTVAARYTDVSQLYGGPADKAQKITPRAGLSYSLNRNTAFYALYDQAFVPQTGQLASGGKVQPVTGNNMEVGAKKDWFEERWTSTLSVYRILKNNELTADPNSPPTSGLSVELGQKTAQGIEFDLRGTILKGFNVIANYAFTESKVTRVTEGVTVARVGDIVPGYATHTINGWLSYKIQSGILRGIGISAGCTFLGDRKTYWEMSSDPSQVLPDYFKLDAGIFWENKDLRLAANMFNVLDTYLYSGSYYSYLNAYYWQSEPGRNMRLSIAYKF